MMEHSTREQIIGAADRLFYTGGYEHTSFARIADAVGISRGNFYHHFKSKDEILGAVIQARAARTRQMLEEWQAAGATPEARIRLLIGILIRNQSKIMRHGCPVGTLCTELAKLGHEAGQQAAAIFTLFRDWLAQQFRELGCGPEADALALHVLGRSQGVATLASAFRDETFVQREVDSMCDWLAAIVSSAPRQPGSHAPSGVAA